MACVLRIRAKRLNCGVRIAVTSKLNTLQRMNLRKRTNETIVVDKSNYCPLGHRCLTDCSPT
jgi:hypothetical protein